MIKLRRILCFILAAVLIFMIPQDEVSAAKKAKQVKLNKSKLNLNVGDTFKLKLKNNKKKVTWSSTKKIVATVSKKGKVKAVKSGNARIIAKVSKKKYICKVSVNKVPDKKPVPTSLPVIPTEIITSVDVLNYQNIMVRLSAAKVLNKENFVVRLKTNYSGRYIKELNIKNVITTDNITYQIVLDNNDIICENNYVQLVINNPDGTCLATKETMYCIKSINYQSFEIYKMLKDEEVDITHSICSDERYRKINSVTGIPAGLTYTVSEDGKNILFKGIASVAGTFNGAIVSEDEFGNIYTDKITWLVGSKDVIAAAYRPIYKVYGAEFPEIYVQCEVIGGSGAYFTQIYETNDELNKKNVVYNIEESGRLRFLVNDPGTYQVKMKITDSYDSNISTFANCDVYYAEGRRVSGTVKDALGNTIKAPVSLFFRNKDRANLYMTETEVNSETGEYDIVLPDGCYEIYAVASNIRSELVTCQINEDKSGMDFTVPIYPVSLMSASYEWIPEMFYDGLGNEYQVNDNDILYIKEGPYKLTHFVYGIEKKSYTISGTVIPQIDNTVQVVVQ